jgi:SPX domain protein involved in polyphosphate accumulation
VFFNGGNSVYRFERKFLTDQMSFEEIEQVVLFHPACFQEIHHQRQVNNIYFDTPDLRFFEDNVSGRSDRVKVRIRWYGESQNYLHSPHLEIKIKKGLVGRKAIYKISDVDMTAFSSEISISSYLSGQNLPSQVLEFMNHLEPVLMNSYKRKYFESFNRRFRFTIDKEMKYYDFRTIPSGTAIPVTERFNRILELKYNQEFDDVSDQIVSVLPMRLTKSSKYVTGVYSIRPDLAG